MGAALWTPMGAAWLMARRTCVLICAVLFAACNGSMVISDCVVWLYRHHGCFGALVLLDEPGPQRPPLVYTAPELPAATCCQRAAVLNF